MLWRRYGRVASVDQSDDDLADRLVLVIVGDGPGDLEVPHHHDAVGQRDHLGKVAGDQKDRETVRGEGTGDGPVDALLQAINAATGVTRAVTAAS